MNTTESLNVARVSALDYVSMLNLNEIPIFSRSMNTFARIKSKCCNIYRE